MERKPTPRIDRRSRQSSAFSSESVGQPFPIILDAYWREQPQRRASELGVRAIGAAGGGSGESDEVSTTVSRHCQL